MSRKNVGVIFDLDDTLYLERAYVGSGFRAVGEWCAAKFGLSGVQEIAGELFDRGNRKRIFDQVLDRLGIPSDSEIVRAMVTVYREHLPQISLLPDSGECLKVLSGRVYLGLLTDGYSSAQWAKIQALGLRLAFDAIIVTGDWGVEFFKPHPRGYQYFETQAPECRGSFVYVADNPSKDFFVPKSLDWKAIRVRRPGALHGHLPCPLDLIHAEVSSLQAIPNVLSELYALDL